MLQRTKGKQLGAVGGRLHGVADSASRKGAGRAVDFAREDSEQLTEWRISANLLARQRPEIGKSIS